MGREIYFQTMSMDGISICFTFYYADVLSYLARISSLLFYYVRSRIHGNNLWLLIDDNYLILHDTLKCIDSFMNILMHKHDFIFKGCQWRTTNFQIYSKSACYSSSSWECSQTFQLHLCDYDMGLLRYWVQVRFNLLNKWLVYYLKSDW